MTYLLALDQGTSSSRSIVFDAEGRIVAVAQVADQPAKGLRHLEPDRAPADHQQMVGQTAVGEDRLVGEVRRL